MLSSQLEHYKMCDRVPPAPVHSSYTWNCSTGTKPQYQGYTTKDYHPVTRLLDIFAVSKAESFWKQLLGFGCN